MTNDQLAALMKEWRAGRQLSQRGAAELLGISNRTLEGIEQGRGFNYPSLLMLGMKAIDIAIEFEEGNNAQD